ncbi:MAG: M4 family metallopeptidase [Syntrophomonadaceae bacterium]
MRKSKFPFRAVFFLIPLLCFVFSSLSPTMAQQANERAKVLRQEADKIYKNIEVFDVNEFTGVPRSVRGKLGSNIDLDKDDQVVSFLKNSGKVFLINPNTDGFNVKKKLTDNLNLKHAKVQQTFKGIPVWGSEVIVHSDKSNTVIEVNGRFTPKIALDVTPSISSSNALQVALSDLGPAEYRWKNPEQEKILKEVYKDGNLSWEPKPELVIAPKNGDFDKGEYRLAWKMQIAVDGAKLGNYEYFVDAVTGDIINKFNSMADVTGSGVSNYNGTVQFSTTLVSQNSYQLYDSDRHLKTYTANGQTINPGTLLTDSDNIWDQNKSAVDAHWGATKVYDFYKNVFNRNSFNDAGAEIISTTQYLFFYGYDRNGNPVYSPNNAQWNGAQMLYGSGDGTNFSSVSSLDVCAHEITHAVTTSTANLTYQGESGALNEAISDILGTVVEFYSTPSKANWLIGEECYTPGTSGDALRYMNNPNLGNQPDTYKGNLWAPADNLNDGDKGGVHTNSGVLNYAFYLMCVGGSGTNDLTTPFNVIGITIEKARAIAYKALTTYLISSSNYADARNAFLSAAAALYGSSSQEYKTVSDAFGAVGIGIRFTAENNFGAGTIKINGFTTSSGSNFFATAGSSQTLDAIPQYSNPYKYVWNTSGSNNSISNWQKLLPGGSINKIPEATNISYTFNASTSDMNAAYITDLKKLFDVTRIDNTEFDGNRSAGVVTSVVEQNSGDVYAPSQLTGGNGRTYNFAGWADGGNGTVSPTDNMTTNALYKITNKSNCTNAFTNSSQKKTKSDGVNTTLVYESMNYIWMESSANMGVSWAIQNFGKPVSSPGIAHDPSIDGTDGADHFYVVGYAMSDAQTNTTKIMASEINGSPNPVNKVVFDNIPGSTYDTQPVVACLNTSAGMKAIMIWRQPAMPGLGGTLPAGLYYRTGSVTGTNGTHIDWDVYNNDVYIAGTDINSFNPTVAGVRDMVYAIPMVFHMTYSQKIRNNYSSVIKYTSLTLNNDGTVTQSSTQEISDPIYDYNQLNEKPSITLVNNLPCVAWKNYNDATYMQSAVLRRKVSGTTWSDTYYYAGKDDDATSVHISNTGNMSSGYTSFVMGWNTSYSGDQFVKSTSLSTIYNSNKNGNGIQVMGGSRNDFNDSYLISFNNTSLPYSFMSSNAIPLGTLAKVSSDGEGRTIEERSGLIKLNDFFIKSSLGDLSFNGARIDFKEPKDILGNSLEHFSKSLETESIDVANSGILTYTTGFEYGDSLKALSFLKEGSHAGFSVELVDAETGLMLKKLNPFTLSTSSLKKERSQSYRLDLSGIGTRKVALRLSSDINLKDSTKAKYFVLRSYAVQRKANKDNFVDLNYSESARVTTYGLSQNYPNPFNPSTVINFQVPKASKVMLKVYDMLGKEVTTLVNEYKEQGRYSVEFNASSLPSGTYIYEIRANSFVKSGKMLLLK